MRQLRQSIYFQIILFLALYAGFYWGNKLFTGLTVPGGLYSSFLDHHLNYVVWFRGFLLENGARVIRLTGREAHVWEYGIRMSYGGVKLVYACMGFAIYSFWWAMILAFPQTVKNKLIYFLGGTLAITGLNILRIAVIALVYNSGWGYEHPEVDHHLMFNIVVYGVLFFMLYRWFNLKEAKETTKTRTALREAKENKETTEALIIQRSTEV